MMDAAAAALHGFPDLNHWMRQAEGLWEAHKGGRARTQGLTLVGNWDYNSKLSAQLPPVSGLRVVYAKSGTLLAATIVDDEGAIIENTLYWIAVPSIEEARYLTAVLNSETARERTAPLQSRGQWGARDIHKWILTLPIPRFDALYALHLELAAEAARAEQVAGAVELRERMHFVSARRDIRAALAADGVSGRIDGLVTQLLG